MESFSTPGVAGNAGAGVENEDAIAAHNHLVQGKRHLSDMEYPSAVERLLQACQLYCKVYGKLARECAEVNYYYGKALLQLARKKNGVIGDGIDKANKTTEDGDDKATGDTGDDEVKDKKVSEKPAEDGDEQEDRDDVGTLQLAREVLQTAKVIFTKYLGEKQENKIKLIDTIFLLGEVSLESDEYQQAISDFQECLELQKSHLPPDSREIAHTWYQLGMAFAFDNRFSDAAKAYQECYNILMLRKENLKNQIAAGQGGVPTTANAFDTPQRELEEIDAYIPELEAKIEDEESKEKARNKPLAEATTALATTADPSSTHELERDLDLELDILLGAKEQSWLEKDPEFEHLCFKFIPYLPDPSGETAVCKHLRKICKFLGISIFNVNYSLPSNYGSFLCFSKDIEVIKALHQTEQLGATFIFIGED